MAKAQANDLREKRDLERVLLSSLRGLFRRIAKEIRQALRAGNPPPDVFSLTFDNVELRLNQHYKRVVKQFGTRLSDAMPIDLRPGPVEALFIEVEILGILAERATRQADFMAHTAKNTSISAHRKGRLSVMDNDALGDIDLPQIVATLFINRQLVHAAAAAQTETQMASESAKGIEAMRLAGVGTAAIKRLGVSLDVLAFKVWRSQGDSRVRPADGTGPFDHLEADGQRIRFDEPFEVSGELLMWPGDISLGASIGNIIRCRCSAIYDEETFIVLRAAFLLALFEDLVVFPQTESGNVVGVVFDL